MPRSRRAKKPVTKKSQADDSGAQELYETEDAETHTLASVLKALRANKQTQVGRMIRSRPALLAEVFDADTGGEDQGATVLHLLAANHGSNHGSNHAKKASSGPARGAAPQGSGSGNSGLLRLALSHGADIALPDATGRTPLARACEACNTDGITALVMHGAPLVMCDMPDESRQTMQEASDAQHTLMDQLFSASEENDTAAMQRVIQQARSKRFNLDTQDPEGLTALHWTSIKYHLDCAKLLLLAGAKPNISEHQNGRSSVHFCLVDCGDMRDPEGNNSQARPDRAIPILEQLLEFGADINQLDASGCSALDLAVALAEQANVSGGSVARETASNVVCGLIMNGASTENADLLGGLREPLKMAALDKVRQRKELVESQEAAAEATKADCAEQAGAGGADCDQLRGSRRGNSRGGSSRFRSSPSHDDDAAGSEMMMGGFGDVGMMMGDPTGFGEFDDDAMQVDAGDDDYEDRGDRFGSDVPFDLGGSAGWRGDGAGRPRRVQIQMFPRPEVAKRKAVAEPEDPAVAKLRAQASGGASAKPSVVDSKKKMRSIRSLTDSEDEEMDEDDSDDCDDDTDDSDDDSDGFEFEDDDNDKSFETTVELEQHETYTLLTPAQFDQERKRTVTSVCDEMGIAAGAASAILRAFAWDVRKLRRAWDDDSIAVFQKAKVDFDMCEGHRVIPATGGMECAVCLDDGMEELILLSGCGHSFCRPCWEGFVASNVKSSEVTGLTCMEMQCKMAVPESLFAQLVQTCSGGDGGLLEKYNRFLAESWVKEQPMVKFCPGMDCDRAIDGRSHISSVTDQTPVKCDCGQVSCWGCSTEQHAPATCKQLAEWNAKFESDHETQQFMKLYVKQCPNCGRMVKKEGGCNHIWNCPCKFHWCWVCQKPWEGHGDFYNCTQDDKSADWQRDADRAKLHLERWRHHSEKFAECKMSEAFDGKISAKVNEIVASLIEKNVTLMGTDVVKQAASQLFDCRRTLKYTYVTSYYMIEGNEREAFKDRQSLFSNAVDRITEAIELPDAAEKLLEEGGRTRLADLLLFAKKQARIYDEQVAAADSFDSLAKSVTMISKPSPAKKKRAPKKGGVATRKSTRKKK